MRPGLKIFPFVLLVGLLVSFCCGRAAHAQTIIRDTEIETYMEGWFKPIFQAAGMETSQVRIVLVQDDTVNAFVAGGSNIFVYTGLLQKTDNVGEVLAVVAHELGHVAGGHLIRSRENMERASYERILGTIIGVGAAIASGDGGAAVVGSGAASSMAERGFLAGSRMFESSADQAAIRFLNAAQINPEGMASFMRKLQSVEYQSSDVQASYIRTHPLTSSRLDAIRQKVEESPHKGKPYPAAWVAEHAMMKAKLLGFIHPSQVEWFYDVRDPSLPAMVARAVAFYRQNKLEEALNGVDLLLQKDPANPYFLELKAQMLVDFGRVGEAVPLYQKAVDRMPQAALIRQSLAHTLIETAGSDSVRLNKAIDHLKIVLKTEIRSPRIFRLLATAYGRLGQQDVAKLYLAEEALIQGRLSEAKGVVETLEGKFVASSPEAIRLNDLLEFLKSDKEDTSKGEDDSEKEKGGLHKPERVR